MWWLKTDNEDFENSTKCCICDNDYNDGDVKVKDHFHITGRYRDSDPHLIMQQIGKFMIIK